MSKNIPQDVIIGSRGKAHSSAALEVGSTTKGFLLPRMTTAERDLIAAPVEGLEVYNTTLSLKQYYDGASWNSLVTSGVTTLLAVTAADTTPGYLDDKLVKGSGLIKTILNPGANEQVEMSLGPHYLSLASTGLYEGAVLSAGATTGTFDLTTGQGFHVNSTTSFPAVAVTPVVISARTNEVVTNILTQPVTYISVDETDTIVQSSTFPTPTERRDAIFIGVVVHSDNVNVNAINNLPEVSLDATAQTHDLMQGLGFFNLDGNRIAANGANLSINKTAGKAFKEGANFTVNVKDPHTITLGAQSPITFRYRNQDSSEGSDVTLIDPTTYDLAGTTTAIGGSNNQATIQRVSIFPSGIIRVQRGQTIFSNFSSAVDAIGKEAFVTEPNIEENGLLLASVVITKGNTDLTDLTSSAIFAASRFGELGSVGSSVVGNLQQAYDNSINPEIVVDPTRGAVTVRDNATPLGAGVNLLEVQDNAGTTDYLTVDDIETRVEQLGFVGNTTPKVKISGTDLIGTDGGGDFNLRPGALSVRTETTTYTSTASDDVILVDTSGGAWTLTLHSAVGVTGQQLKIKKTTDDFTLLTVDGNSSETINGSTTYNIATQHETITIVSDGSNWQIVDRFSGYLSSYTPAITGSGSNPSKGTTTKDVCYISRAGNKLRLDYFYVQTVAGTIGSGFYSFSMPSGLTADTTRQVAGTNGSKEIVNSSAVCFDSTNGVLLGSVGMATSSTFYIEVGDNATAPDFVGQSSLYADLSFTAVNYSASFEVAIDGWEA